MMIQPKCFDPDDVNLIMISIHYPEHEFKLKEDSGKKLIFDELRRIWLKLTPEEWVRQNFLQYLIKVKLYPPSLIAVEKEFSLGELKKRFDLLVYDRAHRPWMLVECKETTISLEQAVLDQILRYHISLPVPYLVITNGNHCAGFGKLNGHLQSLQELPEFGVLEVQR